MGRDADRDGYPVETDCADRDPDVHPGAEERCDGLDNDCDGNTDGSWAGDAQTWYIDYDGDGWGSEAYSLAACDRPVGYVGSQEDCNDTVSSVYPDALELCDFMDNDCDGQVDEEATDATRWYADADHDGYGAVGEGQISCNQPTGCVAEPTDCDDSDANTHVGADEICDEEDQDCDGAIDDDAIDAPTWYLDADGDGHGDPDSAVVTCVSDESAVSAGDDCDDANPSINPEATEQCGDGLDNDCDETDNGCSPNGTVDLEEADAALLGEVAYDNAAFAVVILPDVSGDGRADLAVGIPGDDTRADGAGAVGITFGPVLGAIALGEVDVRLLGMVSGDEAGVALGSGGDMDGDGLSELLVGAPGADSTTADDAGAVYVAYGPVTDSGRLYDSDGRIKGVAAGDGAGTAVAAVGDLDDDGAGDLLIGATGEDTVAENAGAAYVVAGPVSGSVSLTDAEATLWGYGDSALAGHAVSAAGDIDGDGVPDLLVGAPWDEAGGSFAGAAYLVYGPVSGSLLLSHDALALRGEAAGDAVGWAVAGSGDVDADGYADILLGAYGADSLATDAGAAYLIYGPVEAMATVAEADVILVGEEGRSYTGYSVSGGGDVDADGYGDLLIGARGRDLSAMDSGAAYLAYGPLTGSTTVGGEGASFAGVGAGDLAGTSVSLGGDTNGDGFADLAVGGPSADGISTQAGVAWLVLGNGL